MQFDCLISIFLSILDSTLLVFRHTLCKSFCKKKKKAIEQSFIASSYNKSVSHEKSNGMVHLYSMATGGEWAVFGVGCQASECMSSRLDFQGQTHKRPDSFVNRKWTGILTAPSDDLLIHLFNYYSIRLILHSSWGLRDGFKIYCTLQNIFLPNWKVTLQLDHFESSLY